MQDFYIYRLIVLSVRRKTLLGRHSEHAGRAGGLVRHRRSEYDLQVGMGRIELRRLGNGLHQSRIGEELPRRLGSVGIQPPITTTTCPVSEFRIREISA